MNLASRRFRSRKVPRFSPSGDDQIGTIQGGGVVATRLMLDWFDMVAIRLENMMTRSGTIIMTHEEGEPEGWLKLDGQLVEAKLYPRLAAIYGTTGDFVALPDMTDRLPMGAGSLVGLNKTAGQSQIVLTVPQLPAHSHAVTDPGHLHAAIDRGHTHGLQLDEHTHDAEEDPENLHTHDITDPGHFHTGVLERGAQVVGDGLNRFNVIDADTDTATTGITIDEPTEPLALSVSPAEVTGTVLSGRADIRVHKSRSNISLETTGDGASINILNPVRGFNFLVKT